MSRTARIAKGAASLVGALLVTMGAVLFVLPAATASATNAYGPGLGPQTPGTHWGGAYILQGVPGYAYCIDPGSADPVELPSTTWVPVPYPGSGTWTDGEMAALAYFAARFEVTGYPGYTADETVAAIAQVAYLSAGGVTPPASQAPAALVAQIEAWMVTFAGPWTITLTMTPPSGATFLPYTNYSGTITVTSATGNGVEGLQLSAPAVGGPQEGEITNFVWLATSTDAAGQIGFGWNIGAPAAPDAAFSAAGITVLGGAPGVAPPTYAAPAGSGGQTMLVSGASETLATGFSGTVATPPAQTGTLSIHKAVADPAYYGPGGAVFQVLDSSGAVVDTLTTGPTGATPASAPLSASGTGTPYTVQEVTAPPGYAVAGERQVTVRPGTDTVVDYGPATEPVLAGQLGAAKVDAETGAPLPGATFDFRFDPGNDGAYGEDLGTCTTGPAGTCQPPTRNAPGGWLPGWYQVTETAAPPGYWLDPQTSQVDVFLQPGATDVASVTFADQLLGSLRLAKTGNDQAYLAVTGAVFSVTGPAPSSAAVGTLTVGPTGTTGTLTGLVPGTYTVTETTAPAGYTAAPAFSVTVSAGHATTTATVADTVRPGVIVIEKTDATTGDPLAGATFDTRYDPAGDGTFAVDLGPCTTGPAGTCAPSPNDGTGFLPGAYRVTETSAPAGYDLPTPPPSTVLSVPAAGTATFTFTDAALVPASFAKVATGNVNPAELDLAGAVIDVTAGRAPGTSTVTSCTTGTAGTCTTPAVLVAGQPYCWQEAAPPPGLAGGASGCFTATDAQGAQPITVTDAGLFVAVRAEKVDATHPSTTVPGATFDLYRVGGPAGPTPPPGAVSLPGDVWLARATSGPSGYATFPLQLPGYAYCTLEVQAPPGYVADRAPQCTAPLAGTATVPAPATTVVTADPEATVGLSVHKYNAAAPSTGIPGAVYDLYVEGVGPPTGPPSTPPAGAASVPGDRWWARGTTTTTGTLTFRIPAGYSWCVKEVSAPLDYVLDAGLHCSGVLWTTTPAPALTVAVPESPAMITLYTHKFDAATARTTVPGATYELVGQGTPPPGWTARPDPDGYPVPAGDWFVGAATTDATGVASWSVPAGYAWCLHEVVSPAGYRQDTGWHCTAVLTTRSTPGEETVALPEVPLPAPAQLAYTGGPPLWPAGGGLGLAAAGSAGLAARRRRRHRRPSKGA